MVGEEQASSRRPRREGDARAAERKRGLGLQRTLRGQAERRSPASSPETKHPALKAPTAVLESDNSPSPYKTSLERAHPCVSRDHVVRGTDHRRAQTNSIPSTGVPGHLEATTLGRPETSDALARHTDPSIASTKPTREGSVGSRPRSHHGCRLPGSDRDTPEVAFKSIRALREWLAHLRSRAPCCARQPCGNANNPAFRGKRDAGHVSADSGGFDQARPGQARPTTRPQRSGVLEFDRDQPLPTTTRSWHGVRDETTNVSARCDQARKLRVETVLSRRRSRGRGRGGGKGVIPRGTAVLLSNVRQS